MKLPGWLPPWCAEYLGARPAALLLSTAHLSSVFGLRLTDGREVVVKARDDEDGRAAACVAAQTQLADQGFCCARPLTRVVMVGSTAVHAEQWRPGGHLLRGDSPAVARRYATLFAWLMRELAEVGGVPPVPGPPWLRWDHPDPGPWPAAGSLDERDQSVVPDFVLATATRATRRLRRARLPCVLGHADFEAQNLRWCDRGAGPRPWVVHDWDSLAWLPEAALVGAASGAFASAETPTLVPVASSEAFLTAYQDCRGRRFSAEETQVAWAASLWTATHNAREEALFGRPPVTTAPLRAQAADRLHRAGA